MKKEIEEHIKKIQNESNLLMNIPLTYEPMRKNRWLIKFNSDLGIQEWWLSSAQRPKLTRGLFSFLLGYNIEPMTMVFRDPIGESLGSTLLDVFKKNDKIDFKLCMLDPTGIEIETWEIKKCDILEIDFGVLDYSNDSLADITIKLKPKEVKIMNIYD